MKPLSSAFSPEVVAELAKPVMSYDPRAAQLVPGTEAKWYVLEIASRDVEAELVKRMFGIYVPECQETTVKRGRKVDRRYPLFPGYVFVFVWDTAANWNKIADIHGVIASIGSLSDEEIDQIRYLENWERPILVQWFEEIREIPHKRKRKRKRRIKVMVPDEIVEVRTWSAFRDALPALDSEARNQALRQILSSQHPS